MDLQVRRSSGLCAHFTWALGARRFRARVCRYVDPLGCMVARHLPETLNHWSGKSIPSRMSRQANADVGIRTGLCSLSHRGLHGLKQGLPGVTVPRTFSRCLGRTCGRHRVSLCMLFSVALGSMHPSGQRPFTLNRKPSQL